MSASRETYLTKLYLDRSGWGPRHGPQAPQCSGRPGGAVATLYMAIDGVRACVRRCGGWVRARAMR